MIILLGRDPQVVSEVARALEGIRDLVLAPVLERTAPFGGEARAVVFVADRDTENLETAAREVRKALPGIPLFAVLPVSFANVHASDALQAGATRIVWDDRVEDLRALLGGGVEGEPLAWLHAELRALAPGSDLVGQIADALCRQPAPPRSVKRLAALLRMSEATLRRRWMADAPSAPTLGVLLDWALVCGWAQVAGRMSVAAAAASLRVDVRTLERTLRRLGLGSPRQAASHRPALLVRAREGLRGGRHAESGSA